MNPKSYGLHNNNASDHTLDTSYLFVPTLPECDLVLEQLTAPYYWAAREEPSMYVEKRQNSGRNSLHVPFPLH